MLVCYYVSIVAAMHFNIYLPIGYEDQRGLEMLNLNDIT